MKIRQAVTVVLQNTGTCPSEAVIGTAHVQILKGLGLVSTTVQHHRFGPIESWGQIEGVEIYSWSEHDGVITP